MKCLLLGAGYATRLYPLTKDRPKPLLPIAGISMLQRIIEQVNEVPEVDRIYVVTNHRFAGAYHNWLRDYTLQKQSLPVPVEVLDDLTTNNDNRLGAIGDMDFVVKNAEIDDDLLVISGDNLFEFPLTDFTSFARERKSSAICLHDLASQELVSLYGVVETDTDSKVIDFVEKPAKPRSTLISMGVYLFHRKHMPLLRRYLEEGNNADRPGNYVEWLYQQVDLYGYVISGKWFDIGDIDSYNRANKLFLNEG